MAARKYKVGDHVLLSNDREGEVKYVGPVEFATGEMYGIELTDGQSVGKHSGTVDGKEYFRCDKDRGIFCKQEEIRRLMRDKDFDNPRRRRNLSMKSLTDIMKNDSKATVEQLLVIPDDREDDVIISEGGKQFKQEFEAQMGNFSYEELIALCPFDLIGRGVAGVDEMRSFMDDSKVFFGMLQVEVGSGQFQRHKNIFVHFNGEKHRKPLQRAKANKKLHIAKEVIGHCHAPLVVTSADQFTVDWVFHELGNIFVADNIKTASGGKKQDINTLKQDYQKRMAEAQKRAARERVRLEQEAKRMQEEAVLRRQQEEEDRLRRIQEEEERARREKEDELRRQKEAELEAARKKKEEAEAAKRAAEEKKRAAQGGASGSGGGGAGSTDASLKGGASGGGADGAGAGGKKKRKRRKKKKKDDWSDDRPWTGERVLACIHEDKSPLNWAVFKPSKTEVIPLVWGHGDISNLRSELKEDQVMYGIMRLSFGEDRWRRSHWVFFLWTPDSMTELADPKVRTKKNKERMKHVSWQQDMKRLLRPWGIGIVAEGLEKVNVEDWIMRIQKTVVVDGGQELTAEMLRKTLEADQAFFASLKEKRELERKARMVEEKRLQDEEIARAEKVKKEFTEARHKTQDVYDAKLAKLKNTASGTDLLTDQAFAEEVAGGKMPIEETKEEEEESEAETVVEEEDEPEPEPIEIKLSPEELAALEAERKRKEEIERKRSEKQQKLEKNAVSSKLVLESVELCKRTHEDLVWVLFEPRL